MGLDNGIRLKKTDNVPPCVREIGEVDWRGEFEIAYWRKCWNIRTAIIGVIRENHDNFSSDETSYILTQEDLEDIADELEGFTADNWDENYGSFWDWENGGWETRLKEEAHTLREVAAVFDEYHLDDLIYFYDSY